MKTQKLNLANVGSAAFSSTEVDLRDGTVGHVNYALEQIDLATGKDTELNARGRVDFMLYDYIKAPAFVTAENGSLEIGKKYVIDSYEEGDDFTNVGASENAVGVVFTATETTPEVWSNTRLVLNNAFAIDGALNKIKEKSDILKSIKIIVTGGNVAANKFGILGATNGLTKESVTFELVYTDSETILNNLEYFYGDVFFVASNSKVFDSTFKGLEFGCAVNKDDDICLVIFDETVDFRKYTVWSSFIGSMGIHLYDAVDQTNGKIYLPVNYGSLYKFDFEIRLYDYVEDVKTLDVDFKALELELKRLDSLLKEAEDEEQIAELQKQIAELRKFIELLKAQSESEARAIHEDQAAKPIFDRTEERG